MLRAPLFQAFGAWRHRELLNLALRRAAEPLPRRGQPVRAPRGQHVQRGQGAAVQRAAPLRGLLPQPKLE